MAVIRLHRGALRLAFLAVLALAAPAPGLAADDRPAGASHRFRVGTPPIQVEAAPGGFVSVEAAGLDSRHSPLGAPDLPTRTVLVAIPPGAVPRLEVTLPGARTQRAVRPLPRAREYHGPPAVLSEEGKVIREFARKPEPVYRADPVYYERAGTYPAKVAWLGEIGVLRDQRYVEVHVAPVRYESPHGGLVVDAEVEITVYFDGGEISAGRSRTEGPFESVYRKAFVNYEQGRRFRLGDRVAEFSASTVGSPGTGPLRRIRVRENGLLRLDHDFFLAQAPEFLAEPVSEWKLTGQGVQIPLRIHQIPGGGFDDTLLDRAGEYVQFYGQAMDLEPKSVFVSDDGGLGDFIYEARDFTDENVYFLSLTVAPQPAVTERDATPGGQTPAGPYFTDTRHVEVDDFFLPYGEFDLWYWYPPMTESQPVHTESVDLPGLYSGTLQATFRASVKGASECRGLDADKKTGALVTNDLSQQLVLPNDPDNLGNVNIGEFDGMEGFIHEFDWVHSSSEPQLTDPVNVFVQLFDNNAICPDPPGVAEVRDEALLDWIEIDYARRFEALGDSLVFTWNDGPARVFEIGGFTDNVEVYEITGFLGSSYVLDAVRLTGVEVTPDGLDFKVRFRMDNDLSLADGTPRRFAVTGSGAVSGLAPADFEPDRVSELASDDSQADLVVIVHPDVVYSYCTESAVACGTDNDCTGGATDVCRLDEISDLGQLLALRSTQGITSRIARVPDIEDEFNHGLPGPLAIKQFLAWVLAGGWQGEPPTYAMLVGDGSYDYKGGTAAGNYVPTQLMLKTDDILGFYAADNLLATIVGDDFLPDVFVGRVSVRTRGEANLVFQKLLQYGASPSPGTWRSHALALSDAGNDYDPVETDLFEQMNDDAVAHLEGTQYTSQHLRYWSDYCAGLPFCDTLAMRDDIEAAVEGTLIPEANGASLVQFVGHGNFDLWSSDVLFCAREGNDNCPQDDTMTLDNGGRLPWLIVHNCLSGGFHHGEHDKSMGEQWLKRENAGAVAVFAPSGLGQQYIGKKVIEEIWGSLFGPTKDRELLVPVMNSLVRICITQASPEACQYHVLLGDPSTRLALTHVDPPRDLIAVAGDHQVGLSWTGSETPGATYAVYRARWFDGPQNVGSYSLIKETDETSYTDPNSINALHYVYYVVALNPEDFESAWSNFNSDCAEDPPHDDCVLAQPLNLVAPEVPTGGAAEDKTTGGSLLVTWDRNPESDVDYYTIHFGDTPALGETRIQLSGYATVATFGGLTNGMPYYFALSATNTSGVSSVPSAVFSGVPSLVLGVRAPDLIGDLRLARAGEEDTLLSWSAVTRDIYGGEIAIGQYEVFRATLPEFVPGAGNQLGSTAALSFTDSGAFDGAQPDYFYLVRATDVAGNPGGAGRQLPNGIGDLRLGASTTPGNLVMSWSAVTTDFDGGPTQVSHYELYVSDQPFGRGEIQQGSVDMLQGDITGTSVDFLPDPEDGYYSILAVDVRGNRSPF